MSHFHASFKKPAGHPVNYKVPNFGVDSDIKETHASLKVAEKEHKHKLYGKNFIQLESDSIWESGECINTKNYFHPRLDDDIKTTSNWL